MVRKLKPFAYYFPELRLLPKFHIGLITSRANFNKEVQRLGCQANAVWDEQADAFCLWLTCKGKDLVLVCTERETFVKKPVCVGSALISHEFLHVFDKLNKVFGSNIYDHTNVYLFQMLVQDSLQILYDPEFVYGRTALVG